MIESLLIQIEPFKFVNLTKVNNIIVFILNFKENYTINKNYFTMYKKYYIQTYVIFYFRMIWRGKAYRVRFFKKSNKFTFSFGYSHWTKLMYDNDKFMFFKKGRQNYLFFYSKRLEKNYVVSSLNNIRVMNRYTRRGLRLKQTPYIKRFGKISQVNSSLHSFG